MTWFLWKSGTGPEPRPKGRSSFKGGLPNRVVDTQGRQKCRQRSTRLRSRLPKGSAFHCFWPVRYQVFGMADRPGLYCGGIASGGRGLAAIGSDQSGPGYSGLHSGLFSDQSGVRYCPGVELAGPDPLARGCSDYGVMDAQGLRLAFSQIAVRNLLRVVDALPLLYMVGGLACLISSRAQRWEIWPPIPLWSGNRRLRNRDLDQLLATNTTPSMITLTWRRGYVTGPRRQRPVWPFGPWFAVTIWNQGPGLELFRDMAAFSGHGGISARAVEGISDEQYVRNVVGALFRSSGEKNPAE